MLLQDANPTPSFGGFGLRKRLPAMLAWPAMLAVFALSVSCGGAEPTDAPEAALQPAAAAAPAGSPPTGAPTAPSTSLAPISTYTGSGTPKFEGDGGPAAAAGVFSPNGLALDGDGNLFISSDNRVRRVDAATGIITTVAGSGSVLGIGDDGPATAASLPEPRGIAVDADGNLYIATYSNGRVRKVDAATGIITTALGGGIGNPRIGDIGDGKTGPEASLKDPRSVVVGNDGSVYVGAQNRVRKVDAATGIVSTIVGDGVRELSGDGGPALAAQIARPDGMAIDEQGNFYIADSDNQRIRKIDGETGVITTLAGIGYRAPWHHPEYPIRPEGMGFSGDGGPATAAMLATPSDVAVGPDGNLYVADQGNDRIRMIDTKTGVISTVADGGAETVESGGKAVTTFALFSPPSSIVVNSEGILFITDPENNRILRIVVQ